MNALQIEKILSKKFIDDFVEMKERLLSMPKIFRLRNNHLVMTEYRDTLATFNAFVKQATLFLKMLEMNSRNA